MIYKLLVIVEVTADTQQEADDSLRHALAHAKKTEIVCVDVELISETGEDAA